MNMNHVHVIALHIVVIKDGYIDTDYPVTDIKYYPEVILTSMRIKKEV